MWVSLTCQSIVICRAVWNRWHPSLPAWRRRNRNCVQRWHKVSTAVSFVVAKNIVSLKFQFVIVWSRAWTSASPHCENQQARKTQTIVRDCLIVFCRSNLDCILSVPSFSYLPCVRCFWGCLCVWVGVVQVQSTCPSLERSSNDSFWCLSYASIWNAWEKILANDLSFCYFVLTFFSKDFFINLSI